MRTLRSRYSAVVCLSLLLLMACGPLPGGATSKPSPVPPLAPVKIDSTTFTVDGKQFRFIGAIFGGSAGLRSGAAIGALIFGVGGFLSGLFAMGRGSSPEEREEFKQGIRDLPGTLYRFLKKVVKA
ncbi:MAG: hypothetical protein H5T64_03710 [Chloroflexi bacterium]|nr:hypothetical protein [Chloroflexota bacterium]